APGAVRAAARALAEAHVVERARGLRAGGQQGADRSVAPGHASAAALVPIVRRADTEAPGLAQGVRADRQRVLLAEPGRVPHDLERRAGAHLDAAGRKRSALRTQHLPNPAAVPLLLDVADLRSLLGLQLLDLGVFLGDRLGVFALSLGGPGLLHATDDAEHRGRRRQDGRFTHRRVSSRVSTRTA